MQKPFISRIPIFFLLFLPLLQSLSGSDPVQGKSFEPGWPREFTQSQKPWTRWWWMGSAVDKESITASLENFHEKGLGGVEISPIYGAKEPSNPNLEFLSPEWIQMLDHTIAEAHRLGMGVDMIAGTGWPYGGPEVKIEEAASKLTIKKYTTRAGSSLRITSRGKDSARETLVHLLALGPENQRYDLTDRLDESGRLNWLPPGGEWKLYAAFLGKTGQTVKRAAPGGEGLVIDHFSSAAVASYQSWLNTSLGPDNRGIRAFFNDSYEAFGTTWTPSFFKLFREKKGYDLREFLPELDGEGDVSLIPAVKCDYREVLSDLLLDSFTTKMTSWANSRGSLFRSQAHGSPGNILDLYSAADIPECESFGATEFDIPGADIDHQFAKPAEQDPYVTRFAASAAHTNGLKLASSESMTWLREHFTATLAQMKPEAENLFTAGVNHLFFHGSTFTPLGEAWPGWKFYASVNLTPYNTIWEHAQALFTYLTRCQAILQDGEPDSDLLLYFPAHDLWSKAGEDDMALNLSIHNLDEWLHQMPLYGTMKLMTTGGWLYDLISDQKIQDLSCSNGKLNLPGSGYQALVIPELTYMPLATLAKIISLAEEGASIIFLELPGNVPGFYKHEERKAELKKLLASLEAFSSADGVTFLRPAGSKAGAILTGDNLERLLQTAGIERESLTDSGLKFIRRKSAGGWNYYLVNHSGKTIQKYLDLKVPAGAFVLLDPQTGKEGLLVPGKGENSGKIQVYIEPGQAFFIQALREKPDRIDYWHWPPDPKKEVPFTGKWRLKALKGGPSLPGPEILSAPQPWTELDSQAWEDFSGVAEYSTRFFLSDLPAGEVMLQAGELFCSAEILVNSKQAGFIWSAPWKLSIKNLLKPGENLLAVRVANQSVNRVKALEHRGVSWQKFEDINIVDLDYQPLDTSNWPVFASGLGDIKIMVSE